MAYTRREFLLAVFVAAGTRHAHGSQRGLVTIFDDVGGSTGDPSSIEQLVAGNVHWTAAVIPGGVSYRRSCETIRSLPPEQVKHLDVIVHQPMEPISGKPCESNPRTRQYTPSDYGSHFGIYARDTPGEAAQILEDTLRYTHQLLGRPIQGVNNHMGSLVMADQRKLAAMAEVMARHGLRFIDSGTYQRALAEHYVRNRATCASKGVRYHTREVWLDATAKRTSLEQFERGLQTATARPTIGIGHIRERETREAYLRCASDGRLRHLFLGFSAVE